jgi:hypothetical protein
MANNVATAYICPSECGDCESPGMTCTACATGYVLIDGGCIPYSAVNCVGVTESGSCMTCAYGYYMQEGNCVYCVDSYSGMVCRTNGKDSVANDPTANTTSAYSLNAVFALFIMVISLII